MKHSWEVIRKYGFKMFLHEQAERACVQLLRGTRTQDWQAEASRLLLKVVSPLEFKLRRRRA